MSIETMVIGFIMLNPIIAFLVSFVAAWLIVLIIKAIIAPACQDSKQLRKIERKIEKCSSDIKRTVMHTTIDDGDGIPYIRISECKIDGVKVKFWYDSDSSRYPTSVSASYGDEIIVDATADVSKRRAREIHAEMARALYQH